MAFTKGTSGNLAGRPKGQTAGAMIRLAITQRSGEIISAVIDAAVAGDMLAAKMLLDRIVPPLKPITEPVLFEMAQNDTVDTVGQALVDSMSRAEISPDSCTDALKALQEQEKLVVIQAAKIKQLKKEASSAAFDAEYGL